MFYFDELYGNKVLKSDYLKDIMAFFTTRQTNEEDLLKKIQGKRVLRPTQTHSSNVEIVDERMDYPETDGLILDNNEDIVCLKFADCTPLIFYDKEHKIGAVSHGGWRGTAQKISVKTVEKMVSTYKTNPENLIVLIGPAISLCYYEVSEDVKEQLLETVKDKNNLYKNKNVDLKGINARQLQEYGVKQIDICQYCTSCNNDLFYSYRKENGTPNRHKAILKLS